MMAPLHLVETAPLVDGPAGMIVVVVDCDGRLPEIDPRFCDAAVTTAHSPPAPWVGIDSRRLAAQLASVRRNVAAAPLAATLLARVLRLTEHMPFEDALEVESLAYSSLLGGAEFAKWLTVQRRKSAEFTQPEVRYYRDGDAVTLTLSDSATRNAMTAAMRDGLCETLENCLEDPSLPRVTITGAGKCFSTGGHLPEFGCQRDLALAHAIRMARSPVRLLHRLGERGEVVLHGACIGSGIEIAAAAHRRIGKPDTFVQLPELALGLLPGAGGTVTLPRAIGRHRTAWLALGGLRLGARQALGWGLLHRIES